MSNSIKIILFACLLLFSGCGSVGNKTNAKYEIVNGDSVKITFVNDSTRESISVIKNGVSNGLFKSYYKNGNTKYIGLLGENKKQGLWRLYNEAGKLIQAFHYSNDSIITEVDKNDLNFIDKSIPQKGITLSIPDSWEEVNVTNNNILLALKKKCTGNDFCPTLTVTEEDTTNKNMDSY